MALSTYLFFDGDCGDAFDFYASVFGGELAMKTTYAEAPPEMGVTDDIGDRIMHVTMQLGDEVLMGSDIWGEGVGKGMAGGNFAISYTPSTRKEADELFASLMDGGDVSMPMQETFWGAYFGQGTDRFGVMWMINTNAAS